MEDELTITRYIQLDEVFKILDVNGYPLNLIVTETQLPQLGQPKKVLHNTMFG